MLEKIEIKELISDDINGSLLNNFDRYQKVTRHWKNKNGEWILIDEEYVVDWDRKKKNNVVKFFLNTIKEGKGYIFGAYEKEELIGFSVLLNNKFGTNEQYSQLKYLQVSYGHRHQGTGKELFRLCVEKAKKIGITKIYISANDSEETQKFYLDIGCKDAEEINSKLAEEEPYDRQMEYVIE
ncbi:MAG: GNAT family N-acetyltransferase [Treponema sp.]|jgi:N-acetylglutamate synthase-like GNAT family acetyltransferase|nr:GNAT family N-acetyltransferase [Treponema sp.]